MKLLARRFCGLRLMAGCALRVQYVRKRMGKSWIKFDESYYGSSDDSLFTGIFSSYHCVDCLRRQWPRRKFSIVAKPQSRCQRKMVKSCHQNPRCGCWVHLRKKFIRAIPDKRDKNISRLVVEIGYGYCGQPIHIESELKQLTPEDLYSKCIKLGKLVFSSFFPSIKNDLPQLI